MTFLDRLKTEHRETESTLAQLELLLEANTLPEVFTLFQHLKTDLHTHFLCEEQALFPVLTLYRPMILMEVEHDDLLVALHRFEAALTEALDPQAEPRGPDAHVMETFQALSQSLRAHIREEDTGIFPFAETALEPEEKQLVSRKLAELTAANAQTPLPLHRPVPRYERLTTEVFQPFPTDAKPIRFQTLFEAERASLQCLLLKAGQQLAPHWSPHHQCLLVIQGNVTFEAPAQEPPASERLTPGDQLTLSPRLFYTLKADTDAQCLLYKVFPRQFFARTQ